MASAGIGWVDVDYTYGMDGYPEPVMVESFMPRFFQPPLALIDIPRDCPDPVSKPLRESFGQFFSSPPAAANSIRISIEALLTELGIKRFVVRDSKRYPLSLHARIGLLEQPYNEHKELLLAIKWIGNAGSHASGKLSADDVMDAYELIDHVLGELFVQKARNAKKLARRVNRRKGPMQ